MKLGKKSFDNSVKNSNTGQQYGAYGALYGVTNQNTKYYGMAYGSQYGSRDKYVSDTWRNECSPRS